MANRAKTAYIHCYIPVVLIGRRREPQLTLHILSIISEVPGKVTVCGPSKTAICDMRHAGRADNEKAWTRHIMGENGTLPDHLKARPARQNRRVLVAIGVDCLQLRNSFLFDSIHLTILQLHRVIVLPFGPFIVLSTYLPVAVRGIEADHTLRVLQPGHTSADTVDSP